MGDEELTLVLKLRDEATEADEKAPATGSLEAGTKERSPRLPQQPDSRPLGRQSEQPATKSIVQARVLTPRKPLNVTPAWPSGCCMKHAVTIDWSGAIADRQQRIRVVEV